MHAKFRMCSHHIQFTFGLFNKDYSKLIKSLETTILLKPSKSICYLQLIHILRISIDTSKYYITGLTVFRNNYILRMGFTNAILSCLLIVEIH